MVISVARSRNRDRRSRVGRSDLKHLTSDIENVVAVPLSRPYIVIPRVVAESTVSTIGARSCDFAQDDMLGSAG